MITAAALSPLLPSNFSKSSVKARDFPRLSISVLLDRALFWATNWIPSTVAKPDYQTVVRDLDAAAACESQQNIASVHVGFTTISPMQFICSASVQASLIAPRLALNGATMAPQ